MFVFTVELFQSFQHGVELGPCWVGWLTCLPGVGATTEADICWGSAWMLAPRQRGRDRIQPWGSGSSSGLSPREEEKKHEKPFSLTEEAMLNPVLESLLLLAPILTPSSHSSCTTHTCILTVLTTWTRVRHSPIQFPLSMAWTLDTWHFPSSTRSFLVLSKWTVLLQGQYLCRICYECVKEAFMSLFSEIFSQLEE